jgi:hypothetical protein
MGQSLVWYRDDIGRIAQVLIDTAPCPEYAAGVAALCAALGAPVRVPRQPVAVTLDTIAVEVIR